MPAARFYADMALAPGLEVELPESVFRHAIQVLRLRAGEKLVLFNGQGGEFAAQLIRVEKRRAHVLLDAFVDVDRESALEICLVQSVSKGDRMDHALQKATELGVRRIIPLSTQRCNVQLDPTRARKKLEHWQAVLISACEQSGRTRIPHLEPIQKFADWAQRPAAATRLLLHPAGAMAFRDIAQTASGYEIAVGPEGGFTDLELAQAHERGGLIVAGGPRVLRTETAGLVLASVLQARFGDL